MSDPAPVNNGTTTRYSRLFNPGMAERPRPYDNDSTAPPATSASGDNGPVKSTAAAFLSTGSDTNSSLCKVTRKRWHWKTVSVILAFLLAAFLSALGHYLLFENLDGRAIDSDTFTQSNVSAVSILLVTLFKSSIAAAVGSCFAQHLWLVLRGGATSVALIEKLFALRNNVLALADPRTIWRAPVLFLMALFIWCLGIATIYPPGALTVGPWPSTLVNDMEVLSMNRPPPTEFDPNTFARAEPFPTLATLLWSAVLNVSGTGYDYIHFDYSHARPPVNNIAQSIMMGDRMLNTPSHTGENSSYSLQFRAPQFQCNTSTYRENLNMTTDDRIHPKSTGPAFISTWLSDGSIFSVKKYVTDHVYASQRNGSKRTGVVDVEHFQCRGVSVLFDLRVTHPNGIQEIERNISDLQPLKHFSYKIATGVSMPPLPYTNTSHYGEDVRNLTQSVAKLVPAMNERALLDAFGYLVESRSNQTCFGRSQNSSLATGDGCLKPSTLDNGTSIFICDWSCTSEVEARVPFPLRGTALDTSRFNNTQLVHTDDSTSTMFSFNPVKDINPTEDLLNTLLYNITLSAFSLGTWKENVSVTSTLYRNTYQFSHKRNLILPYSVCFGIAIIFAVVAMWSLHQNGISAADGGFLQVMMATRGDTQMERLVLKSESVSAYNVSKDLGSLKVRYGELVRQEGRMGFGTAEETLALRRRK